MSVRLIITGLSPEDAERLFWLVNSGELEKLGFPDAEAEYLKPEVDDGEGGRDSAADAF